MWSEDYYYEQDACLTVKGQTHNKLFGFIQVEGEEKPLSPLHGKAYDWAEAKDREQLISLSSENYPIAIEAKRTGKLWVVINDDDAARWDNAGLFFLKVTRKSRILDRR